MILQYFKKKENKDKLLANIIFSLSIDASKLIIQNKIKNNKDFHVSFEVLSILLFCIFYGLKSNKIFKKEQINQELMNLFVNDLDYSFRRLGVSDIKIGKHVKSYLKKFYFRVSLLEKIFLKDNNFDIFLEYLSSYQIIDDLVDNSKILSMYNDAKLLVSRCENDQNIRFIYKGLFK
jgi:hypothetical protein